MAYYFRTVLASCINHQSQLANGHCFNAPSNFAAPIWACIPFKAQTTTMSSCNKFNRAFPTACLNSMHCSVLVLCPCVYSRSYTDLLAYEIKVLSVVATARKQASRMLATRVGLGKRRLEFHSRIYCRLILHVDDGHVKAR